MKLIALTRRPEDTFKTPPAIWLTPDSALVLPGRPLFLPDFSDNWRIELQPAFRISRLGKSISERFAKRYFDAISLIMRLVPCDTLSDLNRTGEPQCLASAFDSCVQLGEWLPIDESGLPELLKITVNGSDIEITHGQLGIETAISQISNYISLRTGDIVCPLSIALDSEVAVGCTFTATIDNTECLSARIK